MRNEEQEIYLDDYFFNVSKVFLKLSTKKIISKFLKSKMYKDLTQLN